MLKIILKADLGKLHATLQPPKLLANSCSKRGQENGGMYLYTLKVNMHKDAKKITMYFESEKG